MRLATAFYPPVNTSEHIIERDDIIADSSQGTTEGKKVITTKGGVLLGKMSFKMLEEGPFSLEGFELVTGATVPKTGIKINLDATRFYENADPKTGVFRFTNEVASKDADLTNIVLSTGEENEENPDESNYKEYELNPVFDKETKNYTITLLEHLDIIDITATQSNEFATMKIKTPKRDEKGNLMYEEDGTTIIYEEKELTNEEKTGVTLNKLGEPDTIITIHVTAENNIIENEYQITIKRPYGTIKGSIYTESTDSKGIYKSDIRIYKSSDVEKVIDWNTIVEGNSDDVHEKLLSLESQNYETNDDGTYEIYLIPGTYDVLIDKECYLDHIYTSVILGENEKAEFGQKTLIPGDVNKDGVVQLQDLTALMNYYGIVSSDGAEYNDNIGLDFNEDDQIQLQDFTILMGSYGQYRKIESK